MHLNGDPKTATGVGSGQYVAGNWDITEWLGSKTAYATAPGANRSGNGTMYFKKNRQVAVWVHDYKGCEYELGKKGPCSTRFDCSGLQGYMYNQVGYDYNRYMENAQEQYNQSTPISVANRLPGDMIFFDTDNYPPKDTKIDHTGVYVGNNQMVHASGSAGEVVQASLTEICKGRPWSDWAFYGHRYGTNERF